MELGEMSMHVILGKQGSGKTLMLVKIGYEAHRRGLTVYANLKLNFPYKKITFDDIINCRLEKGVVLIDEIHIYLPSRNSMSMNSRLVCDGFISMIRKKGLDLYGTTQFERKVDVRIRDEKDYLYVCTKYAWIKGAWHEVYHTLDLPLTVPIMIGYECMETFSGNTVKGAFIGNKLFSLYDTREIIRIT